jgi:UDP-GlcNAc3NAcA epimerase
MKNKKKLLTVIGARPQFVKAAIFSKLLLTKDYSSAFEEVIVHTGQHYDQMLSDVFFQELSMPKPKYNLDIGSHSICQQISHLISKLEIVIKSENPNLILIYGDTNSTLAAAVVGAHLNIPVVHVEAGERIFRRHEVPEEVNRVLTDNIAALCLTSTKRAESFLKREGMASSRVKFVGDIMYDLFCWGEKNLENMNTDVFDGLSIERESYHLATIHRAQNTNNKKILLGILNTLDNSELPVYLPVHPRVKNILEGLSYTPKKNLKLIAPLGYFDFLKALLNCKKVVTDSGGVTREAFFAKKQCVIPMENSWWTEVIESGWADSTGLDFDKLLDKLNNGEKPASYPEGLFGDGKSASLIIKEIKAFLSAFNQESSWHQHGSSNDLPPTRPTDFSQSKYSELLEILKSKDFSFISFDRYNDAINNNEQFVLMRHDIDFSLEAALEIARIEKEKGVRATYFFMLRNEFYNIFSEKGTRVIREILSLGHHLGLHFDCAALDPPTDKDSITSQCANEVSIIENWFNERVQAISFHRPCKLVLSGDPCLSGKLPHTYSSNLTSKVSYVSDSRGEWKYGHPTEMKAFRDKKPIQILTHPIWWKSQPTSAYEVLLSLIDSKKDELEYEAAKNCNVYRVGELKVER